MPAATNNPPCLAIDASVVIALCAREADKYSVADSALTEYAIKGYLFFAPCVMIAACLFVLCKKYTEDRLLTKSEYEAAVADLCTCMGMILPSPHGDATLIARAEQIRSGYGCGRTADGLYIALAEDLSKTATTELLTFDKGMVGQASRNASNVMVRLLTPL